MELDFKGTWRCRNGKTAVVDLDLRENVAEYGGPDWEGTTSDDATRCWDINGYSTTDGEWDLMERLSERWSSERSGGENG